MKASGMNVLADDGRLIARLYITDTSSSMDQFLAQERDVCALARKFAACEEMLAALEYIVGWRSADWSPEVARSTALAAIAKARGEA